MSPNAYPIYWLAQTPLSGDLHRDVDDGRLIPLAELLDSDRTDISGRLNLYYVEWWSLAHFLLHGQGGRHAEAFRALLAEGADAPAFERRIGPLPRIERAWYAHLRGAVAAARAGDLVRRAPAFDGPRP